MFNITGILVEILLNIKLICKILSFAMVEHNALTVPMSFIAVAGIQ